jgi:hypothetical protein
VLTIIGGWGSESLMDPTYLEIVFGIRVVHDVRAKLCANPPWYMASTPAAPLLAMAPPESKNWAQ